MTPLDTIDMGIQRGLARRQQANTGFQQVSQPAPKPQGFQLSDLLPVIGSLLPGPLGGIGAGVGEAGRQASRGEGFDLGKILTSGALGMIPFGKLFGLGGGAGGLGKALQASVVRPVVAAGPKAAAKEAEMVAASANLFPKFTSAQGKRELSAPLYDRLTTQLKQTLPTIKETVPKQDVLSAIQANLKDVVNNGAGFGTKSDQLLKVINSKVKSGSFSASDIFSLKESIGGTSGMQRLFQKVANQTPLSPQEEATLAVWEGLDGVMTSSFPAIKDLTLQQSMLHRLAPGLKKSAETGVPLSPLGIPVGKLISRPLQSFASGVGKTAEDFSKLPGAGLIPQAAGQSVIQPLARGGASPALPETGQVAPAVDQNNLSNDSTQNGGFSPEYWAKLILANSKYASAITAAQKTLSPAQSKLSSQQQINKNNAQSGLRAISTLEQELSTNPGILTQAAIPFPGGYPASRTFTTARNEASDVLTRLRTGAALNQNEQAFYQNQLPQLFDSPETIQYKLNLFKNLFNNMLNQQGSSSTEDILSQLVPTGQ